MPALNVIVVGHTRSAGSTCAVHRSQVMPDPGAPGGAIKGRWRFRAPCTVSGPLAVGSPFLGTKGCTPPAAGTYLPPPREVMSEIVGCTTVANAVNNITSGDGPAAHAGCMYRNPAIEYIFPEFLAGTPVTELNFAGERLLLAAAHTFLHHAVHHV